MPSLFATRSRSFPIVICRQLLRAVVIQRHRHPSPSPSVEVAVSHRSDRCQSTAYTVSSHSLNAVVSCWQPPSFQFIICLSRRHHFLSAVDIIAVYCLPLPRLLLLALLLVSCRASSPPPLPASTLPSV